MPTPKRAMYAFNSTRQAFLATRLKIADSHWTRLRGLLGTSKEQFINGDGIWIVPCHGVHTLAMSYSIDVIFLDENKRVIHLEENVKPWRFTRMFFDAASVIELPLHTVCNSGTEVGDTIEIASNRANSVEASQLKSA